jgi:DNA repair exonuclease SbcCD nuclease subunit
MKLLFVGDPHVVPSQLEDCEKLMELVLATSVQERVDGVVVLGDLFNGHDVVALRALDFWDRWMPRLSGVSSLPYLIVGNHDQEVAGADLHVLRLFRDRAYVYDNIRKSHEPIREILQPGIIALPYMSSPEAFLKRVAELAVIYEPKTLVCHNTFAGASCDNGYPAPDGIDPAKLPECIKHVISGHLHRPQRLVLPNVVVEYPGAPRWRTEDDANVARAIRIYEFDHRGGVVGEPKLIPTMGVCSEILRLEDTAESPVDVAEVQSLVGKGSRVRVTVKGSAERCRARAVEFEAVGARPRQVPDAAAKVQVRESEGVGTAFARFVGNFRPPYGTPRALLFKLAQERLACAA